MVSSKLLQQATVIPNIYQIGAVRAAEVSTAGSR